ncbi:MAG: Fur family transcriptional regulator [Acidobacteriota bacterium]
MSITKDQARALLKAHKLRITGPRLAVLRVLADADTPLSHSDVLARLGDTDWNPATIYRNLIKLRDAGVAPVASRIQGIDRYALAREDDDDHRHPHFVCDDCGCVRSLPDARMTTTAIQGPWAEALRQARVQLHGACPDCLDAASSSAG